MLIRTRSPRALRPVVAAAAVVALLALGACDSGDDDAKSETKSGATGIVAPGKPGEKSRTLSPEEAAKELPDNTPNSADFGYATMMITHHSQALVMTDLAPDRAGSGQVKRLAERINASQKPEIGAMEGWLKLNGGEEKAKKEGGHDHGAMDMPGMATEAQLAKLRAAKGKAFDELFISLMITHHQGAVTMATDALSAGNNVQLEEMASDVIAQQTSEINRMRSL
ncbi:DUF305 domain-containing protein [Streptomyces sp. NBC_00838]|uniref:DUF305 domain-containing protein n=1 Tax=Streptomyces sp. NBC_00838 TaxID=2903680 RepID=UPI0038645D5E|nr:DUF305 domain-containing protein [Streptomyces sp. NBC_00838]